MNNYVIITDSACDIKGETLCQWGITSINLKFRFENEDIEYSNDEMDIDIFYNRMKNGETAKTSAINPQDFIFAFEEILKEGKDILYLSFSSGLSTTYNSSVIALEELKEKYSDRKIISLDTLCASAGQGLIIYLAAQKKKAGATMEDVASYIESVIPNLCHWFTVDNLVYLKRGGRVSPTVAFVGAVLGIKPILHVDDNGKLVSVTKARGRKAALNELVKKYGESAQTPSEGTVFISQADCSEDADYISTEIKAKYGVDVMLITEIGPVIGAHSGPGTIALFFIGKER